MNVGCSELISHEETPEEAGGSCHRILERNDVGNWMVEDDTPMEAGLDKTGDTEAADTGCRMVVHMSCVGRHFEGIVEAAAAGNSIGWEVDVAGHNVSAVAGGEYCLAARI